MHMGPAEADILLKPAQKALKVKGIRTTRAVKTPLRLLISVHTYFDRDKVKPTAFAFDMIAHCRIARADSSA